MRDEAIFLVKKYFFHIKPAVFLYSGEEDQNEGDHHAYAELFKQAFGEWIVGVRHRPPENVEECARRQERERTWRWTVLTSSGCPLNNGEVVSFRSVGWMRCCLHESRARCCRQAQARRLPTWT